MNKNVIGLIVGVILIFIIWPTLPVADRPEYFNFIDKRSFLGIPNCLDVVSNIFFQLLGLWGLIKFTREEHYYHWFGIILSLAIFLTGFGSGYFHLDPSIERLVWDRLPMTMAFSTIIALLIADRVSLKKGQIVLGSLLPLGLLFIIGFKYEVLTLRPYIVLQFGSILVGIYFGIFTRTNRLSNLTLWKTISFYGVAKVVEIFDERIFSFGQFVSGHSLKHILAAGAVYFILADL